MALSSVEANWHQVAFLSIFRVRSSVSFKRLIGILKSDYRIFFGGAGLSKLASRFQMFVLCVSCLCLMLIKTKDLPHRIEMF